MDPFMDPFVDLSGLKCQLDINTLLTNPTTSSFDKATTIENLVLNCIQSEKQWNIIRDLLVDIIYEPNKVDNVSNKSDVIMVKALLPVDGNSSSNSSNNNGNISRLNFQILLKIYGAPIAKQTDKWYESLVYQYIVPKILAYTPHLSRSLFNIYNLTKPRLDELPQPANWSSNQRLVPFLNSIFPALTQHISNTNEKSLGIIVLSDVNKLGSMDKTRTISMYDFIKSPQFYLLPGEDVVTVFFGLVFQVLYTLECMNRFLLRQNDMHLDNVIITVSDDSIPSTFSYKIDEHQSPIVIRSRLVPHIIDFDRSWSFFLKWQNTSILSNFNLCTDYGQCSVPNALYDTCVFLFSIQRYMNIIDIYQQSTVAKPFFNAIKQAFIEQFLPFFTMKSPEETSTSIKAIRMELYKKQFGLSVEQVEKSIRDYWPYVISLTPGEPWPQLGKTIRLTTLQLLRNPFFRLIFQKHLTTSNTFGKIHNYSLPPILSQEMIQYAIQKSRQQSSEPIKTTITTNQSEKSPYFQAPNVFNEYKLQSVYEPQDPKLLGYFVE